MTFQTHNQNVVENSAGIFITHGHPDQQYLRLQSTDGGRTFTTVYEETLAVNAPAIETDEDDTIYLTFPDTANSRTRLLCI